MAHLLHHVEEEVAATGQSSKDYKASIGTVTFIPGQTRQTIRIVVNGDTVKEPNEFLLVSFLGPKNARLGGIFGLGGGTIVNDDK